MKDKNWFQDKDLFRCTAQQSEGKQTNRQTLEQIRKIKDYKILI